MKRILFLIAALAAMTSCGTSGSRTISSPNADIRATLGQDSLVVSFRGRPVQTLALSFGELESIGKTTRTEDGLANAAELRFSGGRLEVRAYDDGVAFRFVDVTERPTAAYLIPEGRHRWAQDRQRDYEGLYSPQDGVRPGNWAYPLLLDCGDGVFSLIAEAGLERGHCGSYLKADESGRYVVTPMDETPAYTTSPWRVVVAGTLATIAETTLIADLNAPNRIGDASWVHPGLASWIYWAYNHGSNDFQIVKQYIDLAAEMGWPYCLIDAEWDAMGNGGKLEDAVAYAKEKGVRLTIWYNSDTNWTGPGAPGPQGLMGDPAVREAEFARIEAMGIAGVKIDFFRLDNSETVNYYLDLLEETARHHLMIDLHGSTIPRGWQRTYPHLISMEAVYGAEWYNNLPFMTNWAASHNATLPFTRAVMGPMDYTPGTFSDSQHPHITTYAHELALPILYQSTIQHMPDRPEAYRSLPDEVRTLLRDLPTVWDETRLLSGYPGESVVMARRSGSTWYVAGINGTAEAKALPLTGVAPGAGILFADGGEDRAFAISRFDKAPETVPCRPRGGFVLKIAGTSD